MTQSRADIIKTVFENTTAIKRAMANQLQTTSHDYPVSRTQLEVMYTIQHLQPISFKKLAQQLYLTPGAVSQLADSLAQQGLISRQADSHDRRIQSLSLTKKGEKVLIDVDTLRKTVMEKVMQGLSTEELLVWANVQQKLINRFQAENTKNTTAFKGDKN